MSKTPTEAGFYWARQIAVDPGTTDEAEFFPDRFEPVDVFENHLDKDRVDHLRVLVPGIEKSQSLENFEWGAPIPTANAAEVDPDRKFERAQADSVGEARIAAEMGQDRQFGLTPRAIYDVLFERERQLVVEDWTPEHDDQHDLGELSKAAACYALSATSENPIAADGLPVSWPRSWDADWWKPTDRRRDLVKAGALILAEIERLDRAERREKSLG